MKSWRIGVVVAVMMMFSFPAGCVESKGNGGCPDTQDFVDETYGARVRQIQSAADRSKHNIYYHRNPWNADNTYMVGIDSGSDGSKWRVILYDGNGCFIKDLFSVEQYDWRIVWDRTKPEVLYTSKGPNLYRYDVTSGQARLLKSFAPLRLRPSGPSLNQAGDRILVVTFDGRASVFRSYRLPDMQDEQQFEARYPDGCKKDWDDERYTGYKGQIVTACQNPQAILVYEDTGQRVHQFDGIGGGGHWDFSPDGKLAYLKMPGGYGRAGGLIEPPQVRRNQRAITAENRVAKRRRQGTAANQVPGQPRAAGRLEQLELHVVETDGSEDRVVYSVPQAQARYVQNLHLSWPDRVSDWFIASFFPSARNLPSSYTAPMDEIALISVSGKHRFLARTKTSIRTRGTGFWAEPLASPSSDGSRVSFNSNRSGRIEHYVLWISSPVLSR